MNFLSTNGLLDFHSHAGGSGINSFFKDATDSATWYTGGPTLDSVRSGDPIAQYLGDTDNAHTNGSEDIYMPAPTSKWRSTTQIVEYQVSHSDVHGNSPGPAAVIAYGPAFGDVNNGYVMYESGHDIFKDDNPDNIAAVRAFFNLVLLNGVTGAGGHSKAPRISFAKPLSGATVASEGTTPVEASAIVVKGPAVYAWSATCYDGDGAPLGSSGSFANAALASTSFTAPVADSGSTCDLKLKVTDDCGRMTYSTLTINVGNQPPTGTRMQLLVTVSMLLRFSVPRLMSLAEPLISRIGRAHV